MTILQRLVNNLHKKPKFWEKRGGVAQILWPLSQLYCVICALRRRLLTSMIHRHREQPGQQQRLSAPVIVVGNITLGGTGKTPLMMALVQLLKKQGYRPGVVSRGYGGKYSGKWRWVAREDDPRIVGDEPLMIKQQTGCPVIVSRKRDMAAQQLIKVGCDVVLSDDGLQHYRLPRDIEIAVIHGDYGLGNGWCLPAGPLREPIERLNEVDFVLINDQDLPPPLQSADSKNKNTAQSAHSTASMQLAQLFPHLKSYVMKFQSLGYVYSLQNPELQVPLLELHGKTVHAVAGIGHPASFFQQLQNNGMHVIAHPMPDHSRMNRKKICFSDEKLVILTMKDAVKCRNIASEQHYVYPIETALSESFVQAFLNKLKQNTMMFVGN